MKKKIIIGSFAVLAIVALSAYNVYFNNEKEQLSALALANIQALAGGESGSSGCKFSLRYICTTTHSDHYLYRNN